MWGNVKKSEKTGECYMSIEWRDGWHSLISILLKKNVVSVGGEKEKQGEKGGEKTKTQEKEKDEWHSLMCRMYEWISPAWLKSN